ncbi:MAG TPA: hypothetical protein PKD64_01160 [Pirellulaceae bacterium]|nr:hypothetical protein [Pirellulaceae bacterium]HMO90779.1 hypothetical protein [Pirellulaceae bacterium]HMP68030.1 hypothetical protein [Pirellulaceae bacterium]
MIRLFQLGLLVIVTLFFVGCDLGTYEERLEQRIDDMRNDELPDMQ